MLPSNDPHGGIWTGCAVFWDGKHGQQWTRLGTSLVLSPHDNAGCTLCHRSLAHEEPCLLVCLRCGMPAQSTRHIWCVSLWAGSASRSQFSTAQAEGQTLAGTSWGVKKKRYGRNAKSVWIKISLSSKVQLLLIGQSQSITEKSLAVYRGTILITWHFCMPCERTLLEDHLIGTQMYRLVADGQET